MVVKWKYTDYDLLYAQCAYVNGVLDADDNGQPDINIDEPWESTEFTFYDTRSIDELNYRRVYCVRPFVCESSTTCGDASGIDWRYTMAQCAVGIRFDGSPLDLRPSLTMDGIEFSLTDTAIGEVQFNLYRSDQGIDVTVGDLVAGVPYSSRGCGRAFEPIYLVDLDAAQSPGTLFEYGAQAEYNTGGYENGDDGTSGMTVVQYRVPWLAELDIGVEDDLGDKVAGVALSVCKLDGDYKVASDYCPLVAGETDAYGTFIAEIRVADSDWRDFKQHFRVTPSKITEFEDGTYVNHTFDPPFEDVRISHLTSSGLAFSDETFASVSGVVAFDLADSNTDPERWNTDICSRCDAPALRHTTACHAPFASAGTLLAPSLLAIVRFPKCGSTFSAQTGRPRVSNPIQGVGTFPKWGTKRTSL